MKNKIRAIVIDDEPLSREKIKILAEEIPELEIIAEGKDTKEAKKIIKDFTPDLVFLDINMPEESGIEFISKLGDEAPFVIFTTAFSDFAPEAFNLNAVHYLLKPFDRNKFNEAVERAHQRIFTKSSGQILNSLKTILDEDSINKYPDKLTVKSKNLITLVPTSDIIYIQADKNYLLINTSDCQYRLRETLSQMEIKLNPKIFVRIHKSFIVNKEFIKELEPAFNQEYMIKLTTGKKIPTGSAYKENVKKIIS